MHGLPNYMRVWERIERMRRPTLKEGPEVIYNFYRMTNVRMLWKAQHNPFPNKTLRYSGIKKKRPQDT